MKKQILFLLAALSIGMQSCKDKDEVDACVKNFVGKWSCNIRFQGISGTNCSGSGEIEVLEGEQTCEIFFPDLPYSGCDNSRYVVKGTVEGDSFFVYSQPFGLYSITGNGKASLYDISCNFNISSGRTLTLLGSK